MFRRPLNVTGVMYICGESGCYEAFACNSSNRAASTAQGSKADEVTHDSGESRCHSSHHSRICWSV